MNKRWLRAASVTGLAIMAMGLGTIPASGEVAADDDAAFHELAGKRNWLTFADARPLSPFFGIPGELRPGIPFARSWLDASPGRSECFAALYYPDEVVEEGVLQTTGQYQNRTLARTQNPPPLEEETKEEVAPFGMPGPHAATNNPSRTECTSEAVSGVAPAEGILVDGGFARTHALFDGDAVITDEAVSRVQGVLAGPVRIHNLETAIKLEYHLDGEPVISYAMTIAGLEVNGEPVVNFGGNGLVLGGQAVLARDVVDQFNKQVTEAGATFQEQAMSDYIRLVAPVIEEEEDGGITVTGPALEIRHNNTGREGQGGNTMGVRLGYATVYAILNSLGDLDLGVEPPTEEDLTGGDTVRPPLTAEGTAPGGDSSSLLGNTGLDTGSLTTGAGLPDLGDLSTGAGTFGLGGDFGGGSDLTGTADSTLQAAPTAGGTTGSGVTGSATGVTQSAQLAAAESRRAAKNTANGLLGGILVLAGALVWVGGMTVAARLRA